MSFDDVISRRGTGSLKWDLPTMQGVLPMWVADMDFKAPDAVREGLVAMAEHGVHGYAYETPELERLVCEHFKTQHDWDIDKRWIVFTPGLAPSLGLLAMAATKPGEEVLTLGPIYPPFLSAGRFAQRDSTTVFWQLNPEGTRWELDWEGLEQAFATKPIKLLYICNPHNPIGRCWTRDELWRLGKLAHQHGAWMCSDEVHSDLILDDITHHSIATVDPSFEALCITMWGATKTYNIAGFACGIVIIPDNALRLRFSQLSRSLGGDVSLAGFTATQAALMHGESWRQDLLSTLRGNRDRVEAVVAQTPGLSMTHVEATYLAWIDCRGLGLDDPAAHFKAHGVGFSPGHQFDGVGYVRLNFGCPRETLDVGLSRLVEAATTTLNT